MFIYGICPCILLCILWIYLWHPDFWHLLSVILFGYPYLRDQTCLWQSLSIRICKHQVSELTIIVFTGICFMPQLNQRRRPLFRLSSENLLALIYISFTATALLHPFNGLFSRTTLVSRYQKVKTSLDLNEARDYGFWGYIGISWTVCKQSAHCSVQTDNHTKALSVVVLQQMH